MSSVAPVCESPVCDRTAESRGLCSAHYKRFQKGQSTETPILSRRLPGRKETCPAPGCEEHIRLRGFCQTHAVQVSRQGFASLAMTRGGRTRPTCFVTGCEAVIETTSAACRLHSRVLTTYRLTVAQLNDLYATGCELCGSSERLVVDHDHSCCSRETTGRHTCGHCVRGVLCDPCNRGLGLLGDNVGSLQRALDYLSRQR